MATLASLTLDVEDMLYGLPQIERPVEDTVSTAVDNGSDVEWRWSTEALHRRGDYWEELTSDGSAGEIILDTEDHPSGADTTVRRAQLRTTAAGGFSIGDVFRKNPLYPRVKIARAINEVVDNDLSPNVWYRSSRTLTPRSGITRYSLNASDYMIEDMWQFDVDSTDVGDFSYDETGGAAEDLWTISSGTHGLAVDDPVRFTAAGDNATNYAANTLYWVASVVSTTAVTLSATKGGSAIAGSTDSTSDWTMEKVVMSTRKFPTGWFHVVTQAPDYASDTTNRFVYLPRWYKDDETVYYSARTHPSSSAIASLPTEIADMVPYGAMARLLGFSSVSGRSDARRSQKLSDTVGPSQPLAESRFFKDEFERMKRMYRLKMKREKPDDRRYRSMLSVI